MTVTVLFFAQARARAGCARATLELPEGSGVEEARRAIARQWPALEPLWPHLALAVDGELAPANTKVRAGAEIALLPPVSGG